MDEIKSEKDSGSLSLLQKEIQTIQQDHQGEIERYLKVFNDHKAEIVELKQKLDVLQFRPGSTIDTTIERKKDEENVKIRSEIQ